MLQARCADAKPAVRVSALKAMEAWARVSGLQLSSSQLALLTARCLDERPPPSGSRPRARSSRC
eukprot:219203-Prymnesium_polylepis.1